MSCRSVQSNVTCLEDFCTLCVYAFVYLSLHFICHSLFIFHTFVYICLDPLVSMQSFCIVVNSNFNVCLYVLFVFLCFFFLPGCVCMDEGVCVSVLSSNLSTYNMLIIYFIYLPTIYLLSTNRFAIIYFILSIY